LLTLPKLRKTTIKGVNSEWIFTEKGEDMNTSNIELTEVCMIADVSNSLGKTRLSSWDITPLLDNWLLDLPWVGAGPGAHLLGDVNAFLSRLKQGH